MSRDMEDVRRTRPGRVACVSSSALSAVPTGLNSSIGRSQRCVSAAFTDD